MKKAIYPGSFDPVSYGHLDIIKRASKMFDELVVAVLVNGSKNPLFTAKERVSMLKRATKGLKNVKVKEFDGLLTDFAASEGSKIIVRGVRKASDFEYETELSRIYKALDGNIETVLIPASQELCFISSTAIRDIASHGGDISKFTDQKTADSVRDKFKTSEETK